MKIINVSTLTIAMIIITLTISSCEKELDLDEPSNIVPKTVTEDPLLPRIEINGTLLHAEAFGDITNPIIIFLHGGPGGDYRAFISQIGEENASRYPNERTITNGGLSQLQNEFYCVFFDQRGAGLSPRFDKGEITFDLYVEDLNAIIDYYLQKKKIETGILDEQVSLFGWSFGGILSTGYINKYPEKIKDVVLYEPGPFSMEVRDYFIENTTSVFGQIGKDWLDEYLLAHDHFSADNHIRADYLYILGAFRSTPEFHENSNCPLWRIGQLVSSENIDFFESENYDITSNLLSFKGRLLFIGGELTINELPNYAGLQMAYYPQSEFVEIPNVGHTGIWEKPDEVASLIKDFFQ